MPKRKGVYFTESEVEALRSDFETVHQEIGEELIDGAHYGDDKEATRAAVKLQRKLGKILGIDDGR